MLEVLPLSPVREWAISRSFTSRLHETHGWSRQIARQQHRCDGDHIARRFGDAATGLRAVGVERLGLVADPYRLAQALGTPGDADADLVGFVGVRRNFSAMQRVHA